MNPSKFCWTATFLFAGLQSLPAATSNPYETNVVAIGDQQILCRPVVAIAAGGYFAVALQDNGRIVTWGSSGGGATQPPYTQPGTIEAIAAGSSHALALTTSGKVIAWGSNNYRQLEVPNDLSDVEQISASDYNSFALTSSGQIFAWGDSSHGLLKVPAPNKDYIAIFSHDKNAAAIRKDGSVVAWGDSTSGFTHIPDGLMNVKKIQFTSKNFAAALLNSGKVITWANALTKNTFDTVNLNKKVVDFAFDAVGRAYVYDDDSCYTYSGSSKYFSNVKAVSPGYNFTVGLKSDGTLFGIGSNSQGGIQFPIGWQNTKQANTTTDRTYLISDTSSGYVYGEEDVFDLHRDFPKYVTKVTSIAASESHTLAITPTGLVAFWGDSRAGGQPSDLKSVAKVAAGYLQSSALDSAGKVTSWGYGYSNEDIHIPAILDSVTDICSGYDFGMALRKTGKIVSWGHEWNGRYAPPKDLAPVSGIGCGYRIRAALQLDGKVRVWGDSPIDSLSKNWKDIKQLVAGYSFIAGLHTDGSISVAQYKKGDLDKWASEIHGAKSISASGNHIIAILDANNSIGIKRESQQAAKYGVYSSEIRQPDGKLVWQGASTFSHRGWDQAFHRKGLYFMKSCSNGACTASRLMIP